MGRPEWYRGFAPALRADGRSLDAPGRAAPLRRTVETFYFARLAALRLIFEVLFVIKLLFACGEDKVRAAVHTL